MPPEFVPPPIDFLIDAHAEQRARERYGVVLTDADKAEMLQQIDEGRAIYLSKVSGSKNLSVFMVWWPSARRVVPVYHKAGKIESVLPRKAAENLVEAKVRDWRTRAKVAEAELRLLKTGIGGKRTSNPR